MKNKNHFLRINRIMIKYNNLHLIRTSCYMCDGCERTNKALIRLRGVYVNTKIHVSYLFKTDLQTYYYSEPMCFECSMAWTRKYEKHIESTITNAVIKIQTWFREQYYSPPTKRKPLGGKAYQKAKRNFEEKANL